MDERQFRYLQEMGIPLWVSRDTGGIAPGHKSRSEMPLPMETIQPPQIVEEQQVEPLAEETFSFLIGEMEV